MTQQEHDVALQLVHEMQEYFPNIAFVNFQPHPEQVGRYWINIATDMDDEEQIAMRAFVSEKATNILIQHGISLAVMVDNTLAEPV